jgi:hypothetical protein
MVQTVLFRAGIGGVGMNETMMRECRNGVKLYHVCS